VLGVVGICAVVIATVAVFQNAAAPVTTPIEDASATGGEYGAGAETWYHLSHTKKQVALASPTMLLAWNNDYATAFFSGAVWGVAAISLPSVTTCYNKAYKCYLSFDLPKLTEGMRLVKAAPWAEASWNAFNVIPGVTTARNIQAAIMMMLKGVNEMASVIKLFANNFAKALKACKKAAKDITAFPGKLIKNLQNLVTCVLTSGSSPTCAWFIARLTKSWSKIAAWGSDGYAGLTDGKSCPRAVGVSMGKIAAAVLLGDSFHGVASNFVRTLNDLKIVGNNVFTESSSCPNVDRMLK
jgi:hypothetical protein